MAAAREVHFEPGHPAWLARDVAGVAPQRWATSSRAGALAGSCSPYPDAVTARTASGRGRRVVATVGRAGRLPLPPQLSPCRQQITTERHQGRQQLIEIVAGRP